MKYCIITYGCQMNISDSERIASFLEKNGHHSEPDPIRADLVIINTCSVRQSAIDRVWGQLNKLSGLKNRTMKIALTGCLLPEDKKKLKEKFDLFFEIKDLPELPSMINNLFKRDNSSNKRYWDNYLQIPAKNQSPFSALIPIMTGCNNFCSYCVVPYTRGCEISRPVEDIISEIKGLIKKGYKEIWLLGQNVNSYSYIPFAELLKKINDIPGEFWIRFTSSHPKDFTDELIKAIKNCDKVTEYLNLPVQAGDDIVLKKMNRPYDIKKYMEIIKKIESEIPGICLSTDVIVGFPGETKKQFQNTVALFKDIKYDMAYISQYSPRPGTLAKKLKDDVDLKEKKERWMILTETLKKTALKKNRKYLGKTVDILVEKESKGYLLGKSKTYKTVKFKGSKTIVGRFVKVKITQSLEWGLQGSLVGDAKKI